MKTIEEEGAGGAGGAGAGIEISKWNRQTPTLIFSTLLFSVSTLSSGRVAKITVGNVELSSTVGDFVNAITILYT